VGRPADRNFLSGCCGRAGFQNLEWLELPASAARTLPIINRRSPAYFIESVIFAGVTAGAALADGQEGIEGLGPDAIVVAHVD
jgi:hypothetical protein